MNGVIRIAKFRNHLKKASLVGLTLLSTACVSTYQIHSTPEGARVYYQDPNGPGGQVFLGTTPLSYSKAALPSDKAFMLTVQKDGFNAQDIPMAATDESKTVVNIRLKADDKYSNAKEFNAVLKRFFKAQKMIYDKQFHSAILELDELIKEKPDLAQAYVMKGTCYYLLNELNSAVAAWKIALKIDSENPELLHFLDENKIQIKGVGLNQ